MQPGHFWQECSVAQAHEVRTRDPTPKPTPPPVLRSPDHGEAALLSISGCVRMLSIIKRDTALL